MSRNRFACHALAVSLIAFAAGCPSPSATPVTNAPPGREVDQQPAVARYFSQHNDRGMLASMSIVDSHFEPNSDRLSGAGEERLERYAELLFESGGTVNYDTALSDAHLVAARLAAAREFLLAVSLNTTAPILVEQGPSGGRGMSARESIAGQAVAKQAEPRGSAYNLQGAGGSAQGGGN